MNKTVGVILLSSITLWSSFASARNDLNATAPMCVHDQLWWNVAQSEFLHSIVIAREKRLSELNDNDFNNDAMVMSKRELLANISNSMSPSCRQIKEDVIEGDLAALKSANNEEKMANAIRTLRGVLACQYNDSSKGQNILKLIRAQIRARGFDRPNNEWTRYWLTQSACMVYAANPDPALAPEIKVGRGVNKPNFASIPNPKTNFPLKEITEAAAPDAWTAPSGAAKGQ